MLSKCKYKIFISSVIALVIHANWIQAANLESSQMRRLALFVGANDGGPDKVKLKYAKSDAKSVATIFHTIGGVKQEDYSLLTDPSKELFLSHLEKIRSKISSKKDLPAKANSRIEFIFYYSGHADENGILLGKETISFRAFRDLINQIKSDVKVVILDSCYSGEFTRFKGGVRQSPFLVVDKNNNMKGHAFITSSSYDESSQEADSIEGSFFTHYLVSGLRGAADLTFDGQISLNEVYQFAYHETLGRTSKTTKTAQHPGYNIQLSGTGDLVMTDIKRASSTMTLDKSLQGRLFVRDKKDILVLEFNKRTAKKINLAFEPGSYELTLRRDGKIYQAIAILNKQVPFLVKENHFKEKLSEKVISRGEVMPYDDITDPKEQAILQQASQIEIGEKAMVFESMSLTVTMVRYGPRTNSKIMDQYIGTNFKWDQKMLIKFEGTGHSWNNKVILHERWMGSPKVPTANYYPAKGGPDFSVYCSHHKIEGYLRIVLPSEEGRKKLRYDVSYSKSVSKLVKTKDILLEYLRQNQSKD